MNAKLFLTSMLTLTLTASLGLSACSGATPPSGTQTAPSDSAVDATQKDLPPIRDFLACLPREAALVAAHRGTDRASGLPENSISGLEALIARGTLMAEVDLARIKAGPHIVFHDGVWERKTSGKGPVVATNQSDFNKIRLRSRQDGPITGEAVPTLDAFLDAAKDKIYLELDFKSSADLRTVLAAVDARDMRDQVVLIAIGDEDVAPLHALADGALMSLPRSASSLAAREGHGIWAGTLSDGQTVSVPSGALAIGRQREPSSGPVAGDVRAQAEALAGPLDIYVTDRALEYPAVINAKAATVDACLGR